MHSTPFTESRLSAEIDRRMPEQIRRLLPLLADHPVRAPGEFRAGRTRADWAALTTVERVEIATPAIRARVFDTLVQRYGLRLDDGRVIGATNPRAR